MTVADLVAAVECRGGQVFLLEDGIKLTAKKPLPDELVARLKNAKPEIVSFLQHRETRICGRCAVLITPDREFLNIVAGGFPGFIHLACYDAWYDSHIRGRYPGS